MHLAKPQWTLERKVSLAAGLLATAVLLAAGFAHCRLCQLSAIAKEAVEADLRRAMQAGEIDSHAAKCRGLEMEFEDPKNDVNSRRKIVYRWKTAFQRLQEHLDALSPLAKSQSDQAKLAEWRGTAEEHQTAFLDLADKIETGQIEESELHRLMATRLRGLVVVRKKAERLSAFALAKAADRGRDLESGLRTQLQFVNFVAVASLLAVIALACWLHRGVLRRVRTLNQAVRRCASGAWETRIACEGNDCFSELAEHFNELAKQLASNASGSQKPRDSAKTPGRHENLVPEGEAGPNERQPRDLSEQAVAPEGEASGGKTAQDTMVCRVLLAEDGPENRRLIRLILEKAGAEVTVAENGQEALDKTLPDGPVASGRPDPFDVILMDIEMPVLDGWEATRQLRQNGYSGPIVAVTAHNATYGRLRCLEAGFDDFLAKPIGREQLLAFMERYTC